MEFGHEVDQGLKGTASDTSGTDIPDLSIGPDKPAPSEELVKEPTVSRDKLPNIPEGVLNVSRPEHPESDHPDPHVNRDSTENHEDSRETPAAGGGSDKPPTPPETTQGGEYDDNGEGDENHDRKDDILEGMRAAAESKQRDEGEKPTLPGPRQVPAEERLDASTLGGPAGEFTETEAPDRTSDEPQSKDVRDKLPPAEEIDDALRKILGDRQRNDELGTTDETGSTDGIPDIDINEAMGDVAELLSEEGPRDPEFRREASFDDDPTTGTDETHGSEKGDPDQPDTDALNAFYDALERIGEVPQIPDPDPEALAREQDDFDAKFAEIVKRLQNDATRDRKDTDGSEMPGRRGLEAQLGDNVNEGRQSDKDEAYNSPNEPRGSNPSEVDREAKASDNPFDAKNLSSEQLRDIAKEYFENTPNPDAATLRNIARQMREAMDREQAQKDNPETPGNQERGGDNPPSESDNPENPEAG